uniref:Uncharacterized protein n=1 Tax=Opuntia streptacantha TaxID=393608 RepID=A0A7C8YIP2_OPUST
MAGSIASVSVLMSLIIFFLLFASPSPYGCAPTEYECYSSVPCKENDVKSINMQPNNRKILMGLGGSPKRKTGGKKTKESVEITREVPSGPDPLHHNAGPHHRPSITP